MMVSLWTARADTIQMPLESTYAPPKGPQYDGLVRAADDGILVVARALPDSNTL